VTLKDEHMRRLTGSVLLILICVAASAATASAQDASAIEQRIEGLRAQLRDVTDNEARLQTRAQELEESLRPENIQRSVAPIGTTDAEALRDQRRQQLERQRASVDEQLASLAASRSRLEAAIANAEAEAVRIRAAALAAENAPRTDAAGTPAAAAAATPATPAARKKPGTRRTVRRPKRRKPRRLAQSNRVTSNRAPSDAALFNRASFK
jgi:cell division protein FtsB